MASLIHQVVTVLKDTTKLVTEVPFPALTLCGSGLHMNNVEKKLVQDFRNWRTQYKKTNTSREAIEKDMKEFMEERFQIKSSDQPINILDILDMMIAPDVDASIAANGVRENEISCKQSTGGVDDNTGCTKSCSDSRFDLTMGDNCLYLSTKAASQPEAVAACKSMGAELATITKNDQGWIKSKTERDAGVWIGLNDIEKEGRLDYSVAHLKHFVKKKLGNLPHDQTCSRWEWANTGGQLVSDWGWAEDPVNSDEENCLALSVSSSSSFW